MQESICLNKDQLCDIVFISTFYMFLWNCTRLITLQNDILDGLGQEAEDRAVDDGRQGSPDRGRHVALLAERPHGRLRGISALLGRCETPRHRVCEPGRDQQENCHRPWCVKYNINKQTITFSVSDFVDQWQIQNSIRGANPLLRKLKKNTAHQIETEMVRGYTGDAP